MQLKLCATASPFFQRMARILLGLPWGLLGYCFVTHILVEIALVELMLSCNRHVTLRLTVFEIFAVKRPKFRPQISHLGDSLGHRPQKGRRPVLDRYVPLRKISRCLVPPSPRYVTGQRNKTANLVPCDTNGG